MQTKVLLDIVEVMAMVRGSISVSIIYVYIEGNNIRNLILVNVLKIRVQILVVAILVVNVRGNVGIQSLSYVRATMDGEEIN